jgi:hypothetical protein
VIFLGMSGWESTARFASNFLAPRTIMGYVPQCLGRLTHISSYVPWRPGLTEEHKDPSYVSRSADVHMLYTSIFKPRNIF